MPIVLRRDSTSDFLVAHLSSSFMLFHFLLRQREESYFAIRFGTFFAFRVDARQQPSDLYRKKEGRWKERVSMIDWLVRELISVLDGI